MQHIATLDPLACPKCQKPMRLIDGIEDPPVIEKILRHLNLWCGREKFAPTRASSGSYPPPADAGGDPVVEPHEKPDYENVITD